LADAGIRRVVAPAKLQRPPALHARIERAACAGDHSEQSGQPLTKQLIVEVSPATAGPANGCTRGWPVLISGQWIV
jgi:hypothetical protein